MTPSSSTTLCAPSIRNRGNILVEIGPGQGAITLPLLRECGKLEVIEFDRDLIGPLAQLAEGVGELKIHQHDILKFDFTKLASDRSLRIVGNLPYNISTPLLFHLLENASLIVDMHFMLQKEVVDRLAANPGNKNYGRLTVMIQYYCEVEPLFTVGPGAFNPPPKVESAIVRLTPKQQLLPLNNHEDFYKLVRQAFSQRRKTLRNTLKGMITDDVFRQLDIDPSARAETLALESYVRLANTLSEH